jgi:hypothetical protein
MNKILLTSLLFLTVLIIMPNAFAQVSDETSENSEVEQGFVWLNSTHIQTNDGEIYEPDQLIIPDGYGVFQNHTHIENESGTFTLSMHPAPYFEDYADHFVPYFVSETDDIIQIQFNAGKYVFDKNMGAVTIFDENGNISVDSDSYIVKSATVNTDTWTNLDVNDFPVTTTLEDDGKNVSVTFTRSNNEGIFEIKYELNLIEVKTTAYFTNLSLENQKISFTQTLNLDNEIILNDEQTILLSDYVGQTFTREVLEENEDIILAIKNLRFNAGLGFDQLWSVSIHENGRISLDYGRQTEVVLAIGETMELDPTFSYVQGSASNQRPKNYVFFTFTAVPNASEIYFWEVGYAGTGGGSSTAFNSYPYGSSSCSWTGGSPNVKECNPGTQVRFGLSGAQACYDNTPDQTTWNWWFTLYCNVGTSGQTSTTQNAPYILQMIQQGSGSVGGCACNNNYNVGYWYGSVEYGTASAPSAPQSLSIDTQDVANEITLNWLAPSSDGGASITNYKIYLGGSLIDTIGNVLTYDDTISGGEIGASLVYTVKAVNSAGDSVASNTASVTSWNVPSQVTGLSGTSGTNPSLSWSAPSSEASITNYKIYRGGSLHDTIGATTSYSDSTSIVSGTTYSYTVSAVSGVGEGAQSGSTSVVAGVPADPPTNVQAVISDPNSAPLAVTITYTNPTDVGTGTLTGFQLLRNGTAVSTVGLTNSIPDTAPSGGNVFTYTVKSLSTHGTGIASSGSSVTTPNSPDQVTGLTVTPVSTSRIDLSWNTPSDNNSQLSGYKVQISSNGGSSYSDVLTGNVNTVYQALSLNGNAQYHFKVSAINAVGTGTASDVKNTYTMTTTPASLSATSVSQVQINLAWGNSTGATGYKIEYESPVDNGFTTLVNNTGNTDLTRSITSLTTGTQYNFKVSGWNNGGTSVASPEASAYTWGILQAPVIDTITRLSPTSLKVDWTTGTGLPVATGYKIERQLGTGWTIIANNTGTTDVTYTDSTLSSDQSATYRLYAINTIGTSPVSNEKSSDAIASSGGGGGSSSSNAVSSQTGVSGLVDLTYIDQIHRVVLGQLLSKSINVAWDSSDNLEVKSIVVSDSPFRIVFQDVPFVLLGDPSGISNGKINYSVQIPNELCTAQGQINCVEQRQYDIPVEIKTDYKGSTLTKSSVIKIDLAGGSDVPLVFVLLAIGAVPLAFIIRKVGSGKSKRKASGSSHKSSKNGSNSKKVSL